MNLISTLCGGLRLRDMKQSCHIAEGILPMNRAIFLVAAVAVATPLLAATVLASRAGADACAAKLPADAKLIYAAAIGSVAPGIDLREMVRSKTRALVMAGKVSRGQALPAAEAAGACIKQAL